MSGQKHTEPEFDHVTAVNEYGFYCLPRDYLEREVPQVLLAGAVYEPNTLQLMRRLAGSGDVIAGGAFVGDFLPALSQALGKSAKLHTFEPNPTSLAAARQTIALNALSNVTLHPVAVGEKPGRLPLQIARAHGAAMGARARITDTAVAGETVDVDVVPLDELVAKSRKVSVLQLDIEGHEWPALLGARRIVESNAPTIILEAQKAWVQRDYLNKLKEAFPKLGYAFTGVMERNAFFRPTTAPKR